jgi:DNA invertase Pin-like site-specific DNA recombinase
MLVGYIRVSTQDQNTDRQVKLLKNKQVEKMFIEKVSGKNTNREQLKNMLNYVREGDTVIVESYSRLARSTKDLLNIVDKLESKGVNFISLKENIDTKTPQGKLIFTIFAGLAQFEREQTLQRQKEGIEIAKLKGKYKGRKPIDIDHDLFNQVYQEWKQGNITAVEGMKKLNISKSTFYRRVKQYEKDRQN